MTVYEAIDKLFDIRSEIEKNPTGYDVSGALYSAVGMVKLHNSIGVAFAAEELVKTIKAIYRDNLSDFCKRRIAIIEKAYYEHVVQSSERMEGLMQRISDREDLMRAIREEA